MLKSLLNEDEEKERNTSNGCRLNAIEGKDEEKRQRDG